MIHGHEDYLIRLYLIALDCVTGYEMGVKFFRQGNLTLRSPFAGLRANALHGTHSRSEHRTTLGLAIPKWVQVQSSRVISGNFLNHTCV